MKSSNKGRLKQPFSWIGMLVAVVGAIAMWYVISIRDRIEGQIEVNINYTDIPQNLIVTNGLVSKIIVRLRGPEALMRSLPHERITENISLATIKKGIWQVPIPSQHLSPALRAFEIIDIDPPKITVTADTLDVKTVKVNPVFDSPQGVQLMGENWSVLPATVVLRGPESIVSIRNDVTLPITLDPDAVGTTVTETRTLDTPSYVTATPSTVRVRYTIVGVKETISRRCSIQLAQDATHHYSVEPKEVVLKVEVPEDQAKSKNYLEGIKASVRPPAMEPGESKKVKVDIDLPEGAKLVSASPREVKVTRLKK